MLYTQMMTSQELKILHLLKTGMSNRKISSELGVSVNTVKYHLKRIYKKLNAQNRIEAINKFKSS